MGYYSEVGIAMKKVDYKILLNKIKHMSMEDFDIHINMMRMAKTYDPYKNKKEYAGKYIAMYWDSVKWYPNFPEVDFIENFVKNLDDYKFLRIGEDPDDIEEEQSGDCNLDIFTPVTRMEAYNAEKGYYTAPSAI